MDTKLTIIKELLNNAPPKCTPYLKSEYEKAWREFLKETISDIDELNNDLKYSTVMLEINNAILKQDLPVRHLYIDAPRFNTISHDLEKIENELGIRIYNTGEDEKHLTVHVNYLF